MAFLKGDELDEAGLEISTWNSSAGMSGDRVTTGGEGMGLRQDGSAGRERWGR